MREHFSDAPNLLGLGDDDRPILTDENGDPEFRGAYYVLDPQLIHAVNASLALGRPLLVSGEPGCGKTSLGFAIARQLGIERIYFFSAKSDSEARSLFYSYDTLARFRDAQVGQFLDAKNTSLAVRGPETYITYHALGRAILDAHHPEAVAGLIKGGYPHPGTPRRSVVVIDEIDKAPRDLPNDLLDEIDRLYFHVPELTTRESKAQTPKRTALTSGLTPVVVITSNSEKQLPDAFLRRCIFHHIPFPSDAVLEKIATNHLVENGRDVGGELVKDVVRFFLSARENAVDYKPGTAELLDLFQAALADYARSGGTFKAALSRCRSAVSKTREDQARAIQDQGV